MQTLFSLITLLFLWNSVQPLAEGQQVSELPKSQKPPTPAADCQLRETFNLLTIESLNANMNGDGHFRHLPGSSNELKSTARASADFKSWSERNKNGSETSNGQCYTHVSKYAPALIKLLDDLRLEDEGLLYPDNDMPFRVFAKEKSEGIVLSAVTSDQIYNTLKLNARQRAAKEFDSTAMPILREMRRGLSHTPGTILRGNHLVWNKGFLGERDRRLGCMD